MKGGGVSGKNQRSCGSRYEPPFERLGPVGIQWFRSVSPNGPFPSVSKRPLEGLKKGWKTTLYGQRKGKKRKEANIETKLNSSLCGLNTAGQIPGDEWVTNRDHDHSYFFCFIIQL